MDVDEIEEWFRCYADEVKTFLVYFLRRTDVDDLVQETFIRAMRGQGQFRRRANPKTWLLTIARNLAVDLVRVEQRAPHTSDIQHLHLTSSQHLPEDTVLLREQVSNVMKALMELSQPKREVILLRTIMGLSVSETADVFGWTKTRVNVTCHRALKLLKYKLDSKGDQHEPKDGRLRNCEDT